MYVRGKEICKSRSLAKGALQLRRIPGKKNVEKFLGNIYNKKDYNLGYGHFDATYRPQNKNLQIDLPVFFKKSPAGTPFPADKARYFMDNVKSTWSEKYRLRTTVTPRFWKNKLNDVQVFVRAREETNANQAYFKIDYDDNTSHGGDCVYSNYTATLSAEGYDQTVSAESKPKTGYNVYGHETGHMLGLDDEYAATREGHHTDHYDLTKRAFGKWYAKRKATQHDNKNKRSIMNEGVEVRKHHYVTFWDAMIQSIGDQGISSEEAPTEHKDWKIV